MTSSGSDPSGPDRKDGTNSLPIVDHVHLARYTLGNTALEFEVLTLFADHTPEYISALKNAATDKEWRDAAHTLKGSARAVGAARVAAVAERAEAVGFAAELNAKRTVFQMLDTAFQDACRHIAGLKTTE